MRKLTFIRYDADEPAAKPALEDTADHTAAAENEIANGAINNAETVTKGAEPPDLRANTEGNNHNDDYGANLDPVYGDQDVFDGQTNEYHNGDMETEHQNIGIKEDG